MQPTAPSTPVSLFKSSDLKESKGKDREYTDIIQKQVLGTKVDTERDGVKVPTTLHTG